MSTIVTRSGKAAPLTNTELDNNFTNLNTDKSEKASNLSDLTNISTARSNLGLGDLATQNKATLAGPVALSDNSTSPALKITQTGTGNALVVEDAASDTTPFVVDQNGKVVIGHTGATTGAYGDSAVLFAIGAGSVARQMNQVYSADTFAPVIELGKSRNATAGAHAVVVSGDELGTLRFAGSDGTTFREAARIQAIVDGTPGPSDMPARLVFSTTADGASSPSERMRIDSAGNVGIGQGTEAGVALTVRGGQQNSRISADNAAPIFHANVKSRGTQYAQTTANNNDGIVSYQAYAYDGSGERAAATIVMQIDGVPATSTVPGRIIFNTTPAGTSQTPLERLRIDSSGNVLVKSAAGLGYGAGAGAAVTQTGSRNTGVTIHKPTGAITLVSATGSSSWQSFTVTNTVVAAEDVIKVCQKSGTDKYMIHVTNVAASSFQITFATTGGTTTEQPVFNFTVLKGSAS